MLRPALIALAVLIALSVFLVSRPVPTPPTPSRGVTLENVRLTLYPEQDPKARWEFKATNVVQDPGTRESQVTGIQSGQRFVEGKLDMRLSAPSVTIDRNDNMRMPSATAEILKGCYKVELGADGGLQVEIDQREGFKAPSVRISSPSVDVDAKNFKSDFAIENPSWGSGKDTFRDGDLPPCKMPGGQL